MVTFVYSLGGMAVLTPCTGLVMSAAAMEDSHSRRMRCAPCWPIIGHRLRQRAPLATGYLGVNGAERRNGAGGRRREIAEADSPQRLSACLLPASCWIAKGVSYEQARARTQADIRIRTVRRRGGRQRPVLPLACRPLGSVIGCYACLYRQWQQHRMSSTFALRAHRGEAPCIYVHTFP